MNIFREVETLPVCRSCKLFVVQMSSLEHAQVTHGVLAWLRVGARVSISHQVLHLLLHRHLHAPSQQWICLAHHRPLLLSQLHSQKQSHANTVHTFIARTMS